MTIQLQVPIDQVAKHFQRYGYAELGQVLDADELETVRRSVLGEPDTAQVEIADQFPQYGYHQDVRYRQMFQGESDLRLENPQLHPIVSKVAETVKTLLGDDIRILWDAVFMKPPVTTGTRPTV